MLYSPRRAAVPATRRLHDRRGFTLVEIMFSIVFVVMTGLSIVTLHLWARKIEQNQRERVAAVRACTEKIEEIKSMMYLHVTAGVETIRVDIFNTPDLATDDVNLRREVRLFDRQGNSLTDPSQSQSTDDAVLVNVISQWRSGDKFLEQELWTIIVP